MSQNFPLLKKKMHSTLFSQLSLSQHMKNSIIVNASSNTKFLDYWYVNDLTLSCCLNSQRIFLLSKEGCSMLALPAELCCNNLYCCISQILPNSEGFMYHRWRPFTYQKRLFWWQKSPNTLLLLFNSEITVVMLHLGQCVCMKIEVTENQGEAHCSNHIFNEVGDPSYIMSCPHHKIHQRNHILDCLMYSAEHPALHRANYTAKYAPWHFAIRPNWNSVFKINSSDLIPPKPCCELPSS